MGCGRPARNDRASRPIAIDPGRDVRRLRAGRPHSGMTPPASSVAASRQVIRTALLAVLPLIFVPATSGTSDTLVVFVSGDGGWAAIDKGVSRVFAANGMPVIGLDALKYFWTRRTPDHAS